MFTNSFNYNITLFNCDISVHDGVPKEYYYIKNKVFNDWEIPPWELFIFNNRLLGEGSFSKVFLAKWRGTFVVAKVINPEICAKEKELVLREIEIMTKLHHPNIVQFLGYIDKPFIIIMEYIPNKDLLTFINEKKLKSSEKKTIMKDILQGLAYIHNRKPVELIHRDLKPTNILLTNSKVAKITDFGLSKFNKKNSNQENVNTVEYNNYCSNDLTNDVGTQRYMAPELKNNNKKYTKKIDIYSCGILLYEMFENKRYNPNEKLRWFYTPKKIKRIILTQMLNEDPNARGDALSILNLYNTL